MKPIQKLIKDKKMTKNNSETTDIDIVYSILRTDFISFVEKSFQEIQGGYSPQAKASL